MKTKTHIKNIQSYACGSFCRHTMDSTVNNAVKFLVETPSGVGLKADSDVDTSAPPMKAGIVIFGKS